MSSILQDYQRNSIDKGGQSMTCGQMVWVKRTNEPVTIIAIDRRNNGDLTVETLSGHQFWISPDKVMECSSSVA